jgi:hypothetical protein
MTALKLQKRTLLLESDLNRLTLRAELQHLRAPRTWTGFLQHPGRQAAPWAFVVAPLVGVVLALGIRRTARPFGSAIRIVKAARLMIQTGRALAASPNSQT